MVADWAPCCCCTLCYSCSATDLHQNEMVQKIKAYKALLAAAVACACLLCGVVTTVIVLTVKHEVHHRIRDQSHNVNMAQFRAAQIERAASKQPPGGGTQQHVLCPMWSLDPAASQQCVAQGGTCVASAGECDGACLLSVSAAVCLC